jgi:hypothetical protein
MPRDQDRQHWLTRTDAAQLLGTSIAAVRRLEGIKLFPENIAGLDRFRPSEIAAILRSSPSLSKPVPPKPQQSSRRRTPGEQAASVFACFAKGKSLREIVTTLHVSPERVRTLYHHWLTDLETGERLRQPKHPKPQPARSRQRASASAVNRKPSSSPRHSSDDPAASSAVVTTLVENLLGNR